MLSTISLESSVRRILVEKRQGFDLEARALKKDLPWRPLKPPGKRLM